MRVRRLSRAFLLLHVCSCLPLLISAWARASADPPPGFPTTLFGEWRTSSASGPGSAAFAEIGPLTVTFGPDGTEPDQVGLRVGVRGGCNSIGGSARSADHQNGDTLSFDPLISTRMACAGPAMLADTFVAKLLDGPSSYQVRSRGSDLELRISAAERVLVLVRVEPDLERDIP